MPERAHIVEDVAGSLRLEGVGMSAAILDSWASGVASDNDFDEARRRNLTGESLEELLARVRATPRAA